MSELLDTDLVYPATEKPLDSADVVNALNEGRLEVYVKYQEEVYERADKNPSPQARALALIELVKVCYAARERLVEYHARVPLWKRHADAAYLDAYMRRDGEMLDGISELILSYGGEIPNGRELEQLMEEECQ
jgi:hypothetical protein